MNFLEKLSYSVITKSLSKTISKSNLKTLGGYNKANKLFKLEKTRVPKLPKIQSSVQEVPKMKPNISKAPTPMPKKPEAKKVQKLASSKVDLLKELTYKVNRSDIPGTPEWIRKQRKKRIEGI